MLSVSGAEDRIRDFISGELSDKFDTTETDNMGNLIFHKSGSGEKICIECGMDSRGIMVVATENGKAFFSGVGQLKPAYLVGKKILMADGTVGIVRFDGEVSDSTKLSDLYLEIDTESIGIGDFGMVCPDQIETDSKFFANGLSDIIGMAAVIDGVLSNPISADLTVVFSAQKQLQGRGLRAYFTTHSFASVFSVCGCECTGGVKSGQGCALIVKDKTAVASTLLKRNIEAIDNIKFQPLVSSETYYIGNIAHSGGGNPCISLGIPVSHRGKTLEAIEKCDFDETVKLIGKLI